MSLPIGPVGEAGYIPVKTGDWSTVKPVINDKCNFCLLCWEFCPDGVIKRVEGKRLEVDYDYCKGCGICAHECPVKAIEMVEQNG